MLLAATKIKKWLFRRSKWAELLFFITLKFSWKKTAIFVYTNKDVIFTRLLSVKQIEFSLETSHFFPSREEIQQ